MAVVAAVVDVVGAVEADLSRKEKREVEEILRRAGRKWKDWSENRHWVGKRDAAVVVVENDAVVVLVDVVFP